MNFPIDVWRHIKGYQIPYKSYWMNKFNSCLYQLNYHNYTPPNITRCSRIAGKRHRRGHPRRGKIGLEIQHDIWWKNPISRIECLQTVRKNGFVYHHNVIYYPNESRRFGFPPATILYITKNQLPFYNDTLLHHIRLFRNEA